MLLYFSGLALYAVRSSLMKLTPAYKFAKKESLEEKTQMKGKRKIKILFLLTRWIQKKKLSRDKLKIEEEVGRKIAAWGK